MLLEAWNVFMIHHYIKNLTKLCAYLLQLMGPQCAQCSDGIYKIMQFVDKEYQSKSALTHDFFDDWGFCFNIKHYPLNLNILVFYEGLTTSMMKMWASWNRWQPTRASSGKRQIRPWYVSVDHVDHVRRLCTTNWVFGKSQPTQRSQRMPMISNQSSIVTTYDVETLSY